MGSSPSAAPACARWRSAPPPSAAPRATPATRHHGRPPPRGDLVERRQHRETPAIEVGRRPRRPRTCGTGLAGPVLPGQEAAGQREVRKARETLPGAEVGQVALVAVALDEVVVRLHPDEAGIALAVGDGQRLRQPGAE